MADIAEDIRKKVTNDFREKSLEAIDLIEIFIADYPDFSFPRIVRCAVYVAEGNLEQLLSALALAATDWRDLIMEAEYEESNGKEVQMRDLDLPFS